MTLCQSSDVLKFWNFFIVTIKNQTSNLFTTVTHGYSFNMEVYLMAYWTWNIWSSMWTGTFIKYMKWHNPIDILCVNYTRRTFRWPFVCLLRDWNLFWLRCLLPCTSLPVSNLESYTTPVTWIMKTNWLE